MALWTWLLVGLGLVLVIFYLSYRLNRAKATADLAIRLAEAYRSRGQFEAAKRLYQVPAELDQNREEAQQGLELATARETKPPMIPRELVQAGVHALDRDREHLEAVFAEHEVELTLPALDAEASEGEEGGRQAGPGTG